MNEKLKESKIYNFNDCDTVYIPKGWSLAEAIEWYEKTYDSVDKEIFGEVDYSNGFWDSNVPEEKAKEIYANNPLDYDTYNLSINKEIKEGTIQFSYGDLYIYKTFKTAKEENDKQRADIFIICSSEF